MSAGQRLDFEDGRRVRRERDAFQRAEALRLLKDPENTKAYVCRRLGINPSRLARLLKEGE